jgi:hypothetical protein
VVRTKIPLIRVQACFPPVPSKEYLATGFTIEKFKYPCATLAG